MWDGRTRRYALLEKKINFEKNTIWRPTVKILDTITSRSKIFEIIGNNGELISFGHLQFEMTFSIKLPK